MPVRVNCSKCNKPLRIADTLAGKRIRCPKCQEVLRVPAAEPPTEEPVAEEPEAVPEPPVEETDDWLSLTEPESSFPKTSDSFDEPAPGRAPPPRVKSTKKKESTFVAYRDAAESDDSPRKPRPRAKNSEYSNPAPSGWRDHLLWVLLAAFIPLAISVVVEDEPIGERIEATVMQNPQLADKLNDNVSKDDFLAAIPDRRIVGAHLAWGTWLHWGYAGLSAMLFFGLISQTLPSEGAGPARLFWTGLITGTAGIVLLLGFQWVAMWTQGFNIRGRGLVVVLFYIVKFVGYSYRAALDPENGFALSFMGFTCGVGLCEELCKALPVVYFLRGDPNCGWRAACVVGLASGVGFGVSEGITYSSDYYNGIAAGMTYLVRFASCVALHATWSGTVAMIMARNQDYVGGDGFDWGDAGNFVLHYLSIAMVLHGLYDTLLKKEHQLWALAIAAASFGWLIWLVWRLRSED